MKKLFIYLYLLLIPLSVKALSASSVIAMDLNTSRILYEQNINEKKLIASTTKIMTT